MGSSVGITLLFALAAILVALPTFRAEMISRCVTDGTELSFLCPIDDEVDWSFYDVEYDYDSNEASATFTLTSTGYSQGYYEPYEVSCLFEDEEPHHAIIIVTGVQDPVLPIQLFLEKGKGENLTISWNNPSTTFTSTDNINYEYRIRVNVTDGPQTTYTYQSEAHNEWARYEGIDLTGQECKEVEIAVSLPGNCKEKTVTGALLITPEQFLENAKSEPLFSTDTRWKSVVISFTLPVLCPQQEASYILSFNDGEEEEWSRDPVEIESSGTSVEVILDTAKEPRLKRERNYTLRVTLVTEYANVSSETDFSTETQRNSPGAITNLMVVGYNESRVNLAWKNPAADYQIPAFIYSVTISPRNSKITTEPFLQEEDPFISIDLRGYECKTVELTVALYGGDDEEGQLVNATLPSYNTSFRRGVHVETSLYDDGTVREAEITFTPPRLCEFQRASYMLVISGGNKTWSTSPEPVVISDSRLPVKIELETGFSLNTLYTANVTVIMNTTNISSSNNFSFKSPAVEANGLKSGESVSSSLVGGAVGGVICLLVAVLLCGFGTGMVVVYQLRRRKEKKQRENRSSVGRCMVHNSIYGGSGDIYEELPEDIPHPLNLNGASAVPATSLPPSIPPPRKTDPLNSTTQELSVSEKEAIEAKLGETGGAPDARSLASSCPGDETEDCYTVMSPAGTLTVLPRNNRHSAGSLTAGWPMAGTL